MESVKTGLRATAIGMATNVALAGVKIGAGVFGNSYALIADGIESTADIFSSFVVWSGLRISDLPPDENHPYGHGKAESIAGIIVSLMLLAAAVLIAIQSIREIVTPHHAPGWFTLPVLAGVIVTKEFLFRLVFKAADSLESTSLKGDAWHHRSDALTSAAAFIGISIALIGGKGYESADDWGALAACGVIAFNGLRILKPSLDEIMDASVPGEAKTQIEEMASGVPGVVRVEKCRVRKSGLGLYVDIHVHVLENLTVRQGHEIAHEVVRSLKSSRLRVKDVVVHVEPAELDRK
jgi:cation diffusion facilitator family transporter